MKSATRRSSWFVDVLSGGTRTGQKYEVRIKHLVLDNEITGGNVDNLIWDLKTVRQLGSKIGLHINEQKCEIITDDLEVAARMQHVMANIRRVQRCEATLHGTSVATVGDEKTCDNILTTELTEFERIAYRLSSLNDTSCGRHRVTTARF
jgi:hypothetical protein